MEQLKYAELRARQQMEQQHSQNPQQPHQHPSGPAITPLGTPAHPGLLPHQQPPPYPMMHHQMPPPHPPQPGKSWELLPWVPGVSPGWGSCQGGCPRGLWVTGLCWCHCQTQFAAGMSLACSAASLGSFHPVPDVWGGGVLWRVGTPKMGNEGGPGSPQQCQRHPQEKFLPATGKHFFPWEVPQPQSRLSSRDGSPLPGTVRLSSKVK